MTTEETSAHAPVPGDPDYPLHSEKTIGRYFRDQVAIDPDHEFVVYPDRMLRWTYKDFDERTDNLARGLLAIGLRPGDHLGVWARNIPDWLTFMYATAKIGVVMVTVNPIYKSHELDYVLKQSDMKALCVIDAYRDVDYLLSLIHISYNKARTQFGSASQPNLDLSPFASDVDATRVASYSGSTLRWVEGFTVSYDANVPAGANLELSLLHI